jgi:hypothetical protein
MSSPPASPKGKESFIVEGLTSDSLCKERCHSPEPLDSHARPREEELRPSRQDGA